MHKGKIVFVVGHSNWGKSRTLRELTDGNYRTRQITILDARFFIRRMSNDDRPRSYENFMTSLMPESRPYVIAALCPQFETPKAATESILTKLKDNGYQMYFWVIKHQFGTLEVVKADEVGKLEEFGKVSVYEDKSESLERSKAFYEYVAQAIKA